MSGRDLHITQRHAGVEGSHDEPGAEHVRMDDSESAAFADRADPTVSGAPIQALAVLAAQDRSLVPLTNNQIDRPRRAGHERDRGGLAALAEDPQRAMAALHRQVLNVGSTRL